MSEIEKDSPEITIDKIKLTDLVEADYNPRYMSDSERNNLKSSLATFGVVDPIIINLKNNRIIGGHQRYKALIDLIGEEEADFDQNMNLIVLGDIGWVFPNTDLKIENEDFEKGMNLALNKIQGDWEYEKLNDLLDQLKVNDFDLEPTGFIEIDVDLDIDDEDFYADEDLSEDEVDEELAFKTQTKEIKRSFYLIPGETWKFGKHKLLVGDITGMDVTIHLKMNDMQVTFKKVVDSQDKPMTEFVLANRNEGNPFKNVNFNE